MNLRDGEGPLYSRLLFGVYVSLDQSVVSSLVVVVVVAFCFFVVVVVVPSFLSLSLSRLRRREAMVASVVGGNSFFVVCVCVCVLLYLCVGFATPV